MCPVFEPLHFVDILRTADAYRLALEGRLTMSPLAVTDYMTVWLLLQLRISVESHSTHPEGTVKIMVNSSPNAIT